MCDTDASASITVLHNQSVIDQSMRYSVRFRDWPIGKKITVIITLCLLVAFIFLTLVVGYVTGKNAVSSSMQYVHEITEHIAVDIDKLLSNHLMIVESTANTLTVEMTYNKNKIIELLKKQFDTSDWIVATFAGYEPDAFDGEGEKFTYNNDEMVAFVNEGISIDTGKLGAEALKLYKKFSTLPPETIRHDPDYGFLFSHGENGQFLPFVTGNRDSTLIQHLYNIDIYDFYQAPKRINGSVIVPPWTFNDARFLTICTSIKWPDGTFRGVAGLNIDVGEFLQRFNDMHIYEGGYVFIIYKNGMLITYPEEDITFTTNIRDIRDQFGDLNVDKLIGDISMKYSGVQQGTDPITGKDARFVYQPLEIGEWGVVVVVPDEDIFRSKKHLLSIILLVLFVTVVFISTVSIVFVHRIVDPIGDIMQALNTVTDGNFSHKLAIHSKDEIGQMGDAINAMSDSLHTKATHASRIAEGDISENITLVSKVDKLGLALQGMTSKLNELLSRIHEVSGEVETESSELVKGSAHLTEGAVQQVESIAVIASSISEISAQTTMNAEHANRANEVSKTVSESADNGAHDIESMVKAMESIKNAGDNINEVLALIEYIASKTNLLALNAEIEAAHSGEDGKGFAVVAGEVRNLADRTATAVSQTTRLIEDMLKSVEHGNLIALQTQKSLTEIVEGVNRVTQLMEEIAEASTEQADALSHVNKNLHQIENVTKNNSVTSENATKAARQLSLQATNLRKLVSRFKLNQ